MHITTTTVCSRFTQPTLPIWCQSLSNQDLCAQCFSKLNLTRTPRPGTTAWMSSTDYIVIHQINCVRGRVVALVTSVDFNKNAWVSDRIFRNDMSSCASSEFPCKQRIALTPVRSCGLTGMSISWPHLAPTTTFTIVPSNLELSFARHFYKYHWAFPNTLYMVCCQLLRNQISFKLFFNFEGWYFLTAPKMSVPW